jgi:hypothetical protein
VDVYDVKCGVNEDHIIDPEKSDYYGRHRLAFEDFVKANFTNVTIIRLPGLFGEGLKKNFIYDILNPIPKFLTQKLLSTWESSFSSADIESLKKFYFKRSDGIFEKVSNENDFETATIFSKIDFSSLSFTDSRHSFQFYNLDNLWDDISMLREKKIPLLNLTTEPVTTNELYSACFGKEFKNEIAQTVIQYDLYSKFAPSGKYFYDKATLLREIKNFLISHNCELPR